MSLVLDKISKSFGKNQVLNGLDLKIEKGEFHTLLGPSGSGKSVLLNIIAGLMKQDSGNISFSGKKMSRSPTENRPIGYVFQDFALFPNMSVFQNIAFGLSAQGIKQNEICKKVDYYLDLFGIKYLQYRIPGELSGGEKQRVAIARSLVLDPEIILFDEPLSHLDSNLHRQLIIELKTIHKKTGITCLYVTHNREEAMNLADKVSVLNRGHIIQTDYPEELYYRPKNRFVATFVGAANVINCRVIENMKNRSILKIDEENISSKLNLDLRFFPIFAKRKEIAICLHSEKLELVTKQENKNCFPVTVKNAYVMDCLVHITVDLEGLALNVKIPRMNFDLSAEKLYLKINDDSFYPLCGRCESNLFKRDGCEHYVPEFKPQFAKG